jgi:hypothetical protein
MQGPLAVTILQANTKPEEMPVGLLEPMTVDKGSEGKMTSCCRYPSVLMKQSQRKERQSTTEDAFMG